MTFFTKSHRRRSIRFRDLEPTGLYELEADRLAAAWANTVANIGTSQLKIRGQDLLDVVREMNPNRSNEYVRMDDAEAEVLPEILDLAHNFRTASFSRKCTELENRIAWLSDLVGFDEIDQRVLALLARVKLFNEWSALADIASGRSGTHLTFLGVSNLLGLSAYSVERRLHSSRGSMFTAFVSQFTDGEIAATDLLLRIARSTAKNKSQLARQLMPCTEKSSLRWADFDHLGALAELAERLIVSGEGSSILLFGPPGTGKTEFAKLLAGRTGLEAIFVGEVDEEGNEPGRADRLAHLSMMQAMTMNDPTRLLVIDEADDVLVFGQTGPFSHSSKLWLNRLVEKVQVPTIWIMNNPRAINESLIRRMDLAIEFPKPSRAIRQKIVRRHATKLQLSIDEATVEVLAAMPVAPAVIESAIRGAKRVRNQDYAVLIAEGLVSAISGSTYSVKSTSVKYDPTLSTANLDLDELATRLAITPSRSWSLLLSGPSGTGKSAFARHVADRIGIEVIEKSGSDLLSKWVGGTEAAMTEAFRDAAQAEAVLLIDEADDFLFDRAQADHGWQRSMVNEMLRNMEALKAPFIATTNFGDLLDPATQRRFSMHAKFDVLESLRAAELFSRYFGCAFPKDAVPLLEQTPGDFDVVAKRAMLLGQRDKAVLVTWLREEALARNSNRIRAGF